MPEFYPIPEAAKHTGKSVTTIRRFVRSIASHDQHPDRGQLLPSPDEVRRMRAAGEQFPWTISVELLDREFRSGKTAWAAVKAGDPLGEVVSLLRLQLQDSREQLKVKDQQIASQVEIIHSLNERIHEGNVLMATVQKQLALAEPVAAPPVKPAKPVERQSTPKRPARKGLLARLFR
jgi:hypothetical protein